MPLPAGCRPARLQSLLLRRGASLRDTRIATTLLVARMLHAPSEREAVVASCTLVRNGRGQWTGDDRARGTLHGPRSPLEDARLAAVEPIGLGARWRLGMRCGWPTVRAPPAARSHWGRRRVARPVESVQRGALAGIARAPSSFFPGSGEDEAAHGDSAAAAGRAGLPGAGALRAQLQDAFAGGQAGRQKKADRDRGAAAARHSWGGGLTGARSGDQPGAEAAARQWLLLSTLACLK